MLLTLTVVASEKSVENFDVFEVLDLEDVYFSSFILFQFSFLNIQFVPT